MKRKIIIITFILIFSIILWGSVSLSGEYFTTMKLPIEFTSLPKGHAIGSSSIKEISISLKGQGWQLAKIAMGGNLTYAVSAKYDSGKQVLSLRNALDQNSWISSTIQAVEVSPDRIEFDVERISRKRVKINFHKII